MGKGDGDAGGAQGVADQPLVLGAQEGEEQAHGGGLGP